MKEVLGETYLSHPGPHNSEWNWLVRTHDLLSYTQCLLCLESDWWQRDHSHSISLILECVHLTEKAAWTHVEKGLPASTRSAPAPVEN